MDRVCHHMISDAKIGQEVNSDIGNTLLQSTFRFFEISAMMITSSEGCISTRQWRSGYRNFTGYL